MGAKKVVIDFSDEKEPPAFKNLGGTRQKSMSKKQIRARARRGMKITQAELEKLYKPMEEWDEEELARGRPRASDGTFKGASPTWISRSMHEQAMARFKGIVEGRVRQETVTALNVVHNIMGNEDVDEKGRPAVPAGVKLDAAKWLIDHAIGKPTQRQEVDVSVRLQALLAVATAGPLADGAEALALPPGLDYEAAFADDDDILDAEVVDG